MIWSMLRARCTLRAQLLSRLWKNSFPLLSYCISCAQYWQIAYCNRCCRRWSLPLSFRPSHTHIRLWFNRKRWIYYWSEEEHITIFHRRDFFSSFFFFLLFHFVLCRTTAACCAHWLTIKAATRLSTLPRWAQEVQIWMRTIFHLFFVSFTRAHGDCKQAYRKMHLFRREAVSIIWTLDK